MASDLRPRRDTRRYIERATRVQQRFCSRVGDQPRSRLTLRNIAHNKYTVRLQKDRRITVNNERDAALRRLLALAPGYVNLRLVPARNQSIYCFGVIGYPKWPILTSSPKSFIFVVSTAVRVARLETGVFKYCLTYSHRLAYGQCALSIALDVPDET